MFPGVGEPADGLNCAWYGAEGKKLDAGLSCASMIPLTGWGTTLTKWGLRGAKGSDEAATAEKATADAVCSFSGSTLVEMSDGSTKPISEIKVGDEVVATDPETGRHGPRKVTHFWVHHDVLLILETATGQLVTTEDHPFWNATDGEFQRADQLDTGDELLTSSGQAVRVKGIRHGSQRTALAYNLTVDDIHTYYVLAGTDSVLVHNVCKIPALPAELSGGPANVRVYRGNDLAGEPIYVGITSDLARRQSQHGARFQLQEITTSAVTRGQARAIEQALMDRHPFFANKINSISPDHSYYGQAVAWGEAWLKANGL